jgi:O-antigen/teichoic acid export membrane protein
LALANSIRSGHIRWHFDADFFKFRRLKVIQRYGFFTFLTTVSTFVVQTIDSVMLGAYVNLEAVGIYTIAFFMGSVIAMPARSVSRIAIPVIAQAWKDSNLSKIADVYTSTSFLQFLSGGFIFGLILLNLDAIFQFLPPIYATGFGVVVFIGLGHWIDMTGGLNANILVTSSKYHLDIYINAAFIFLCILFNMLLIPAYGLTGAAVASLLSYAVLNAARCAILYALFGFNPFGWRYLTGVAVLLTAFAITWFMPMGDWSVFLTIPLRGAVYIAIIMILGWLTGIHKQIQSEIRL